tara:strand:- start:218 stop:391 length:174 start_codon:yes stop_codon:yes gene_type:complete
MTNAFKTFSNHHARNAVKAGHVTSHIVKRKKDGLTHEEAKKEAHVKFAVKTSKYPKA